MASILGTLLSVLLLIVLVGVVIFGGIGALLARQRGGSAGIGFGWGALLGPIGWIVIWRVFPDRARVSEYLRASSPPESVRLESAVSEPDSGPSRRGRYL